MRLYNVVIAAGLLLTTSLVRAEDPANRVTTNEKGEAVWKLNSYVKGTTSQIRDLINGDVERLTAQSKETQGEITQATAEIAKETDQALRGVRASQVYKELIAQRDAAEAAKKDAHGQELLDASSRANHARQAVEKMESDAVDRAVHSDHHALVKLQTELAAHHAALAKAKAWRENLIDSMRTTFLLEGPIRVGERGLLGKVAVDRVIDPGTFVIRYDALEITGVKDAGEGTQTLTTRSHKAMLILAETGMDTSKMKNGDELLLDRDFEVTDTIVEGNSKNAVFLAHPTPSPVDDLMKAVMTVREMPQ